jgi:cyclophilin family peptidyl-prolyl cis-trans isomerase
MKTTFLIPLLLISFLRSADINVQTGLKPVSTPGTTVLLQTTLGDIKIRLYDETPLHRDNFIKLVKEHYYDNVLFHRVIAGFMIQTGDPDSKTATAGQSLGMGGPGYKIPAEIMPQFFHKKGALAAARQGDAVNPKKESSGSQFYIVVGTPLSPAQLDALEKSGKHTPFTPEQREAYTTIGGTPHLDMAYTVFGEVIEGLDIVDKIAAAETDNRNRPLADIRITHATIVQ